MSFSVKKRQSKSIKTYLTKVNNLEKLQEDKLKILTEKLAAGDLSVVREIVLGHARLAIRIAGQYCFRPSQEQDLVSVALLALVDGCLTVAEGKGVDNITGYLISLVHSRCNRFACEDRTVRVPRSSLIKASKEGRLLVLPRFESSIALATKRSKDRSTAELREFIFSCCVDDRERNIVRLRIEHYTNIEIGELLQITAVRVGQILADIEKRYDLKIRLLN